MLPEPSQTRSICSFLSCHSLQFPLSKSERHFTVIPLRKALPSSVALCSSLASFRASLLTGHIFLRTLADSTLLIHCSSTECPVVLFFCHYRRASHDSLNILLLFGVTQKHKKSLKQSRRFGPDTLLQLIRETKRKDQPSFRFLVFELQKTNWPKRYVCF